MTALAASDRPIRMRMRPDLVLAEQWFSGRPFFVVKDPLRTAHSYLTQQEHFILQLLDGGVSAADVERQFAERFAPQRITTGQLQQFVANLHRSGLVLSEAPGQGEQLVGRQQEHSSWNVLRALESVLSLRWRGFDPDPILRWLDPVMGWLFSGFGFAVWLVVLCCGAFALLVRADELEQRSVDLPAWLASGNLPWLALALIVVKTLHEIGHGLAARRMGSPSREMGVQLFLLLPCLYTDVSDVWLLPSKCRRIVVSAAGMYVEVFLAAIAAIVWSLAEPGVLSSLCQGVFWVASIGTILLNGNPLLRYDGYHILSDLIEVPNLERRSQSQLLHWLVRVALGVDWWPPEELERHPRAALAIFAAAAIIYRVMVLAGVYFILRAMLQPFGASVAADALAMLGLAGIIFPLAITLRQSIVQIHAANDINYGRLLSAAAFVVGIGLVIGFVPMPQRITAPLVLEARGATRLYASVAGELREALPAGTQLSSGQIVASLENPEMRRDLARLESELRRQQLLLIELETVRGVDPSATAGIPAARESQADLQQRIARLQELIARLTLSAPHEGVLLPPPRQHQRAKPHELDSWTGTPLDPANRGSTIETGTLVGLVARPGELEAIAVVEQADAALIRAGSRVALAIAQVGGGILSGTVEEVARAESDELPLHLEATRAIPQRQSAGQSARNLTTFYQVRIKLDTPPTDVLPGALGRARIVAASEPLATRLSRWIAKTVRFRA